MILVTQPNFDITTNYISRWSDEVISLAKSKGIKVVVLKGKRANRAEFESINSKIKPKLVFLNGHGDYDLVCGHNNEPLIKVTENEECLKYQIVYALSCRSGKVLGVASVKKGATAYIGYSEDFVFHYRVDRISNPLQDDVAEIFFEPSNAVVKSLAKGHSVQESWENSQKTFRRKMIELLLGGDRIAANTYLPVLHWNMQNQVCLGDYSSTI